ncbi:MAG: hypothetical protein ACJ718_08190 [Nitrososphaeraceae archaeon]
MLSVERTLFTIIFLKEYSVIIDGNMFTKRTMAALFTIAIASSLIAVSGSFVGSAFAKKASGTSSTDEDKSSLPAVLRDDSPKSKSTNADDSSGSTGDISGISVKDLKSLSKCQSGAAEDGDLTQAEVTDCYSQVF